MHNVDTKEAEHYCPEDNQDNNPGTVTCAYNAAVNAIQQQPSKINKPCIVCNIITGVPPSDGHRFEQCPILQNTDLIRENHKDFCKMIMRSRRLHNSTPPIKGAHAVSFDNIDTASDDPDKTDRDNTSPTGSQSSDFLQGHP